MGEIERQAQMCVLYAPQDGLVIYDLPPLRIDQGVVLESHVGESVKEGQKLAHVADLKRLNVHSRIHESVITQVRAGQQATVRVDAFPNQVLPATVKQVATVASPQAWLRANVKVYDVQLAILGEMPALKPGMTAEVRIAVGGKKGVVQVPVQAVLGSGGESFCYVKAGQEIQKRKVVPGVRSEQAVEIKAGVKEGEEVLRDPRGLLERLRPVLIPPAESKRNKQTSRIRAIQIRNGAPGMAKGGSCWGNRRRDVIIPDTKDSAIAPQINLRC
jgi:HlyD family secretion protein